jgi:O-antigen ligase
MTHPGRGDVRMMVRARWAGAVGVCVLLPWLNPAAGGPSAVMQPWFITAAACLLLWALVAPPVSRLHLSAALLLAAVLTGVGRAAPPVLLAVAGLVVMALSASAAGASGSRPWTVSAIAFGWLCAALVSSVFALAQYFGLSAELGPWVDPASVGEAFANLRQRNQFATLTSIGIVAILWQIERGARLSFAIPGVVLLAVANAASGSRTGVLQIGLIVSLTWWWCRPLERRTTVICLSAVLAYGLGAVLLPLLLQEIAGVTVQNAFARLAASDGCSSRSVLWSNVLHLVAQKPWWGWGWGELDFAHFTTLYPGARFCDILDNAHNLPLQLAVELGVPIAVLVVGGFGLWVVGQRPWREQDATRRMAWGVAAVILLHSMLEYPLWYGPFQMAFGFSLGFLARPGPVPADSAVGRVGRAIMFSSLVGALLFAVWDYHRISQLYTVPEERSALYRGRSLPRVGDSWLFRDQLGFAELSVTPLTLENAGTMNQLALDLLHYSPEPRVIESAIASAMLLHREDEALWLLARYRAAFPQDYEKWSMSEGLRKPGTELFKD